MINMDKIFDAIEEVGQYTFYAVAGTAILVGTCWAVGAVIVSKSIGMIQKKDKKHEKIYSKL